MGIKRRENKTNYLEEILKIFIEVEISTILVLILHGLARCVFLSRARHNTRLLIITYALLEEIRLPGKGDGLHEIERVTGVVIFLVAESDEQAICDEFDVLLHQSRVHAEQSAREGIDQEFLLDGDGFGDDVLDGLLARSVVQVGEEEACEVSVETLIAGDEFIGECKSGHKASFLKPED